MRVIGGKEYTQQEVGSGSEIQSRPGGECFSDTMACASFIVKTPLWLPVVSEGTEALAL